MLPFVILHYGLSVLVQAFLNSVEKFDCKMKQFGVAICILERVIRVHFYYMKIVKLFILSTHSILERERERERERGLYVYRHKSFRSYNATSTNLQQVQQAWAHKWA